MVNQKSNQILKNFIARAQGVPFRDQGRSFAGWDCWGLILSGYQTCFGVALPDLARVSALDAAQVGAIFGAGCRVWRDIPHGAERPGDVALFRRGRWPCHAGLVIAPGHLLHVEPETATCVEPFYRGLLRQRLVGIYRHEQLAGAS